MWKLSCMKDIIILKAITKSKKKSKPINTYRHCNAWQKKLHWTSPFLPFLFIWCSMVCFIFCGLVSKVGASILWWKGLEVYPVIIIACIIGVIIGFIEVSIHHEKSVTSTLRSTGHHNHNLPSSFKTVTLVISMVMSANNCFQWHNPQFHTVYAPFMQEWGLAWVLTAEKSQNTIKNISNIHRCFSMLWLLVTFNVVLLYFSSHLHSAIDKIMC